jgi:hypothetical protein
MEISVMPGRRGALPFKQTDVARAIRGAKKAEMDVARVEIDPHDGTLTIVPLGAAPDIRQNEWDKALGKPPAKIRLRI